MEVEKAKVKVYVLDACAVVALMQREPGADVVAKKLKSPDRCLIHAINACEVYYDVYRRAGLEDASALEELLANSGIELVDEMSSAFWQTAGKIKAEWKRVSLADCFALALADKEDGTILTSDHREFDPIAEAEIFRVEFIR